MALLIFSLFFSWWGLIQIISKEDVESLGKKGELLDVRAGYYRNFLFPTVRAQIVTT